MRAEQVTGVVTYHGEGPVWADWTADWTADRSPGQTSGAALRFVDMLAGAVLTLRPDGGVDRLPVGSPVAAVVRPRAGGGSVIGVERGFALEGLDGTLTPLDEVWADDGVRMNEGGCDPLGRFYCGSMAYDQATGAATLYRLDPDLSVHVVLEGVTVSNGLEWSPDGTLAYYDDTPTHRIAVFDQDAADGLVGRRTFVEVVHEGEPGNPDGLTVDAEGGVWVALYGAGVVHRYTPEGLLDGVVEIGASQVTACTFGGPDLAELFVTTSREGLAGGQEPAAGSVFRVVPGVRGRSVRAFAG